LEEVLQHLVRSAYFTQRNWEIVVGLLEEVIPLDQEFVKSGKTFEEDDLEYAIVLVKLLKTLEMCMSPSRMRRLESLFLAFPNMCKHFRRIDSGKRIVFKLGKPPVYKTDKLSWLFPSALGCRKSARRRATNLRARRPHPGNPGASRNGSSKEVRGIASSG
jgi:hypothetical protein